MHLIVYEYDNAAEKPPNDRARKKEGCPIYYQPSARKVMPMLSEKLQAFEEVYDLLNETLFENSLQKCIITISPTPRRSGHFTYWESWQSPNASFCEINLGAESIDRPALEIITTLVHEMVHQYNYENNIKDTSRSGTYHNKRFKKAAEAHGLIVERDSKRGWSRTKPGEALCKLEAEGLFKKCEAELEKMRIARLSTVPPTKERRRLFRTYVCPSCGVAVRASKEVRVKCVDCDRVMEEKRR